MHKEALTQKQFKEQETLLKTFYLDMGLVDTKDVEPGPVSTVTV